MTGFKESWGSAGLISECSFYGIVGLLMFIAAYMFGNLNGVWDRPLGFWSVVYFAKAGIEVIASGFAMFYFLVALFYKKPTTNRPETDRSEPYQHIAIAYLCCDDLEHRALESVVACAARYSAHLLLHDDSVSTESRADIDKVATVLGDKYAQPIHMIRRSDRVGGKPGAVNNILQNLPPDIEYLLLCDNDSFLPDCNFLEEALTYFHTPEVAVVQLRNIGQIFSKDSHGYKILSMSVDFYDAFVDFMDRFGWSPFLGHNALLRVSAMRKVGGFTAGQLADDIDYSVKLRLRGYTIRYARGITAGERHPLTYESLRRRTLKWTYGCTQILIRWGWGILISKRLSPGDKMTFLLSVGYYHFQLLLLVYLIIFYICLPFHDAGMGGSLRLVFSAGMILFFTFIPSITYFARNHDLLKWLRVALYWGFTYGSQDFVMLGAVLKCLLRRHLGWSPTNSPHVPFGSVHFLPELFFACLILLVCSLQQVTLLFLPTTILFVGKFLATPFLNALTFERRFVAVNKNADALGAKDEHSNTIHKGSDLK